MQRTVCERSLQVSAPGYATPTGQAPRALPSPRCGKHASPVRRSPSGSSMWSVDVERGCPSQLTTMRVSSKDLCSSDVGDGARAAGDGHAVMGLADSKKIQETRAGPGQASSGGGWGGEGYHGGAEHCQWRRSKTDTCFSIVFL